MPISKEAALLQIDSVLERREALGKYWGAENVQEVITLTCAAIERLAPARSAYLTQMEWILRNTDKSVSRNKDEEIELRLHGVLRGLRSDYDAGRMQSFTELVHADLFSDFLEMAEYFLQEGYKDPAAVLAGGVLEEHLRKLCAKHCLTVSPKPKLDTMNADLAKAGAYAKGDQKQVTAWADLRNDAAHGKYENYRKEMVELMLAGVRGFISRNPA